MINNEIYYMEIIKNRSIIINLRLKPSFVNITRFLNDIISA